MISLRSFLSLNMEFSENKGFYYIKREDIVGTEPNISLT